MRTRPAIFATLPALLVLGRAAAAEFGDPVPGLTADELRRFDDGRTAFAAVEGVPDGLGPVFNGTSCGGCHSVGGVGGGSELVETRFGVDVGGVFDPLVEAGGSLVQSQGIGVQGACTFVGERVPAGAIEAHRRTTPLFGLGLVDAVPDAAFVALAGAQARRHPRTAGRPNMVVDVVTGERVVGRFGWKAQVPNLFQFSGDAYLNEMGITTPLFPDESCPQGDCTLLACDPVPGVDDDLEDVQAFADFMSFLAPPPSPTILRSLRSFRGSPRPLRSDVDRSGGSRLFADVGCATCHVRSLASGPSPVAALRARTFHPYSDFLLHDMGDLGDGIAQGEASGHEMRTAPLWGLRLLTTFLHDGRATTIEDAILAHEGQGRGARDRFAALTAQDRAKLVAFLRTL
jgi:CxxC motif-containing protein (DUF1111 family)